jgi:2-alkyl-3-oxoalkanoate reductase
VRVLVTGASGMLGSATARSLAARGDRVTVLQRRPAELGLPEVLADVADAEAIRRAVSGHEAVVHLAAKVDVTGPWAAYARANIAGTQAVVAACRAAGVPRLVHVSTPSVAHTGQSLMGESAGPADPEHARGRYARSKAVAERIALAADDPDLAVTAIRPHLVWGPGDTQLVSRVVARARAGRLVLIGSGAGLIDTTYVDNAAAALVAAVDRCPDVAGQPLVVTNGEPRPVGEMFLRICAAAGVPGPRRHVPRRLALTAGLLVEGVWAARTWAGLTGEPPMTRFVVEQLSTAHWFDQRRTRDLLQWRPAVSLEEGFEALASWFRQNPLKDP